MSLKLNTNFILGFLLGYAFYLSFCNGHGTCAMKNNQFSTSHTKIHLHHWLLHVIVWMIVTEKSDFFQGLLMSGIMHGLMYKNWYHIVKKA